MNITCTYTSLGFCDRSVWVVLGCMFLLDEAAHLFYLYFSFVDIPLEVPGNMPPLESGGVTSSRLFFRLMRFRHKTCVGSSCRRGQLMDPSAGTISCATFTSTTPAPYMVSSLVLMPLRCHSASAHSKQCVDYLALVG